MGRGGMQRLQLLPLKLRRVFLYTPSTAKLMEVCAKVSCFFYTKYLAWANTTILVFFLKNNSKPCFKDSQIKMSHFKSIHFTKSCSLWSEVHIYDKSTVSTVVERHSVLECHFDYNVTFLPKMTLFQSKTGQNSNSTPPWNSKK